MSTAIEFEHVSKQYRLGLVSTKTLSHDIRRFWITNVLHREDPYLKIGETNDRSTRGNSEYVWALRDIDFKVEQGDVVGIIGKNGAGKSTLLKLLSRVTGPTTGTIRAHGRIGSLLEVGTGFHGEMTGRENIFMNGAILGMTRNEIQAKLDEIIDFSGCERYIDTPVKRYSSGMTVRLGFAVAAFLEPEILVVDEVLAVGDAEFQKKAIGKMKDVSTGEGRTVLFVSHNMASVRNLCNTGVLLDNGMVKYRGDINETIDQYVKRDNVEVGIADYAIRFKNKTVPDFYIQECSIVNKKGEEAVIVSSGEPFVIKVKYYSSRNVTPSVVATIYNSRGDKLQYLNSKFVCQDQTAKGENVAEFIFERCPLPQGVYYLNLAVMDEYQMYDWIPDAVRFDVLEGDFYKSGKLGAASDNMLLLEYKCRLHV